MRENTGRQLVSTINFNGSDHAAHDWSAKEIADNPGLVQAFAEGHEGNIAYPEYVMEYGMPEVTVYEGPGYRVTALLLDGKVFTVFTEVDADTLRYHTAVRTGRIMRIRYVKESGERTLREVRPTSVRLTRTGDTVVRADDLAKGEGRAFRADRITHTVLHRQTLAATPSKSALVRVYVPAAPVSPLTGFVRHTPSGRCGDVVPGSRALSASGWSVLVEFDGTPFTASGTTRLAESDLVKVSEVYSTEPGTRAALTAPEDVQDRLADAWASGRSIVLV